MKNRPLTVGYLNKSYPYKRNIIGISKQINYKQIFGLNAIFSLGLILIQKLHLPFSWYKIRRFFYLFVDLNLNQKLRQVDILHFFNTINHGTSPWIVTFEEILPIYHIIDDPAIINISNSKKVEKALQHLAAPSCLQVIALSHHAERSEKKLLTKFPSLEKTISDKITVAYPPQKLLIENLAEKNCATNELSFIFVGRHFYRKGGYECVKAFQTLKKSGDYPIRLTIIGDISLNASPNVGHTAEQESEIRKIIAENSWIDYHQSLNNSALLQKMKASHVGLLPTYSDTFGYSLLEMQAAGVPVISTDVQALPEINSDLFGWLIKVPKSSLGHALYQTTDEQLDLSQLIQQSLENILLDILENPEQIFQKAEKALEHIRQDHSPENYATKLEKIYQKAPDKR